MNLTDRQRIERARYIPTAWAKTNRWCWCELYHSEIIGTKILWVRNELAEINTEVPHVHHQE